MGEGQRFDPKRLQALMDAHGLTSEYLAARIRDKTNESVTGETIRRWLSGRNYPQVRQLHALADALDYDIRLLFPDPKTDRLEAQVRRKKPGE